MQKWFNSQNLISSVAIVSFMFFGGTYLIILRHSNQIGFGYAIGLALVIESIVLMYKKYYKTSQNSISDEEE
tara:strand:+ start:515 stop:730 length:216 start_codon:yes stop_codon:yes gene_type:complete